MTKTKNPWKTIKKNVIYQNKYGFLLREDDVINPKGGKGKYMVLEHPGYVFIVALTKDKQVILERQWRYAVGEEFLEIPSGAINREDKDISPLITAKRELSEETGATSKKWFFLGSHWLGNGFMKKRGFGFLVLDVKFNHNPEQEDTENITVELMNFDEAIEKVTNNEFQDYKTKLGLLLAKEFLQIKH